MTDITKLCDEIEALAANCETVIFYAPADGGVSELKRKFDPVRLKPLIDAARIVARYTRMSGSGETLGDALDLREENMELRERVKELEQELNGRGG